MKPIHGCWIEPVDPRVRIVVAAALSLLVSVLARWPSLILAAASAACCLLLSGMSFVSIVRRLLPTNVFMALFVVVLALTAAADRAADGWAIGHDTRGWNLALPLVVKGNVIMAVLIALLGQLHPSRMAHALAALRVPTKLVQLSLFTVRYFDLLHREYRRLIAAMRLRAFRPAFDMHTCRVYGTLVGVLLLRCVDRSERIMAAMKCRGFQGDFRRFADFGFTRRDALFLLMALVVMAALIWLDWR